jgi:hypothetical protein
LGTLIPGTGRVFDRTFTETQAVAFTPGQVLSVFDRMTLTGFIDIQAGPVQETEHVDLDSLDPVTVRAQVFDAQGNLLTNVTATSALGVNDLGNSRPNAPYGSGSHSGGPRILAFRSENGIFSSANQ